MITRYVAFFDDFPEFLPMALESFVDHRGLHHPNELIRNRVSYLFLRFIKASKQKLSEFVAIILQNLFDCLVVDIHNLSIRPSSSSSQTMSPGIHKKIEEESFLSQLYVFEAVGKLISMETYPDKQAEYLSVIFSTFIILI